ncbi:hypothetical protein P8452_75315 [Trifolium repens]|nr:hypothetical protein P8452_65052 [Trifolium repens]WJX93827.1 hypothetical protein P8452_75315 [Trifolium repens]
MGGTGPAVIKCGLGRRTWLLIILTSQIDKLEVSGGNFRFDFSTLKVLGKLKLLQMEQGDETMARMTSARQGSVQQHRSSLQLMVILWMLKDYLMVFVSWKVLQMKKFKYMLE